MIQFAVYRDFGGGMTLASARQGPKGSFRYSRGADFRKQPDVITNLPQPDTIGPGVIDGLIQDIVQVPNGTRFALDDNGGFYKLDTSDNVTRVGDVKNGAAGLIFRQDIDRIIISSSDSASSYYPVSGTPSLPSLQVQKYGPSASADVLAYRTGGTNTYMVPLAIDETVGLCTFQPDIEPGYSIKPFVITKGSGDWTLTLHDDANNVLATVTITNANLVNNTLNEFVFGSVVRMLVKPNARTYHWHLTSTVADGTVAVGTVNDLTTANFEFWATRFVVPNNGLHPMEHFLQYICIGNERYLSVWEPLEDTPTNQEWQRHRLTFPPGYEVSGLAIWRNYLAIACEQRSTTNTRDFQTGRIFLWNGTDSTYTDFIDIPEGSPQSIENSQGVLYWIANHALWGYDGGKPIKLKTFPQSEYLYTATEDFTFINPHMLTTRNNVLLMGYPTRTINQNLEHGVYSYGSIDKDYSPSFGLSYTPSQFTSLTNNGSNNLRIGMVKNYGQILHISWRNDQATPHTYGLDTVENDSSPNSQSIVEALILDNGEPYKRKLAKVFFAQFTALTGGQYVQLKYRLERTGNWIFTDPDGNLMRVEAGTSCKFRMDLHFFELEMGVEWGDGVTATDISALGLMFDNLRPLRLHGKLVAGEDYDLVLE